MGLTHLDSGVVIALLNGDDSHHHSVTASLTSLRVRDTQFAMSATAFAECLVSPFQHGIEQVEMIKGLFERLPIHVIPFDSKIAEKASALRATQKSLRLPDAIVIATAVVCNADLLLTTDRKWPKAEQMGFEGTIQNL